MSTSSAPRRAGQTPTNQGRFRAPPAPVSGVRVRRGVTPRSASKKAKAGVSSASYVLLNKPKFTVDQRLEIIRRIQSGDFRKGEGLQQFQEHFNPNPNDSTIVANMTCRQNLYSSFASLDNDRPLMSSTRNYGSGKTGSNESLVSLSNSVISSVPSHSSMIMGRYNGDLTLMDVPIPSFSSQVGQVSNLDGDVDFPVPEYIKLLEKLLLEKKTYFKCLEDLVSLSCRVKLAELLPREKMCMFLQSIDRVKKIIQKYLKGNPSDKMNLFMPTAPNKAAPVGSFIHCDVEKSAKIIKTIYDISEILKQLENFLSKNPKEFLLEQKLESLKDYTNEFEDLIKKQERYSLDLSNLIEKAKGLKLNEIRQ